MRAHTLTTLTGLSAPAALAAVALLGGCPGPAENAPTLWLALDGRETEVKLVDFEPEPY
jgi:hypothetical protein